MRLPSSVIIIMLIYFFFNSQAIFSQTKQDSTQHYIKTTSGNEYIGHIIQKDSFKVVLLTNELGQIAISNSNIKKIKEIKPGQIKDGKYWFENFQATRHFWSPNGYGLKQNEGYYQNVWIFFNQFSIGITDNISLGIGTAPMFLFGGEATPVWLLPKVSIPLVKDKLNIAGGALIGTILGGETTGYGIVYSTTTYGSKDNNMSLGLGWGYIDNEFAKNPVINFSAIARTGPRGYFITENYYFPSEGTSLTLISIGGRRLIKSVGLDYGLIFPISEDIDSFAAMPWLGLTVPFGNNN